jgi:outer membrane protein OmpA-like peptidoglycan-associated protein/tetratricopeptide (TPR) repeat protein
MINLKKTGLMLVLALLVVAKTFSQSLKDAEYEFNKMSYLNAAEMFEQVLKGKLSDSEKQSARMKLAYAYRQIHDSQNTERVYRELISGGSQLSGDASKAYLYYAQALASNGKYKDAQEAYEKYSKVETADKRSGGFQKLYKNVETLNKNAACYKVDYLSINSDKADFSPMYYKNGLVFNSSRTEGTGLKRVFCWDNSRFLDMYYLTDLTQLTSSAAGLGGSGANKTASRGTERVVGSDEYTAPTANDTRTVGTFGGTNIYQGYGYTETAQTKTQKFSKSLNSKYHEGPMTFSSDGKKVIFTRNNYTNGKYKTSSDKINKLKIYTADDKGAGQWNNIKEVPFNSNEYSTGHPSLSKDDKLMYFVSDMPGGFGGTDLYVVQYNGGAFGTPVNLGPEINTAGNEMFPFVDERGNLYFSSDGHAGLGDLDIFYAQLIDGSKLKGKIKNMGTPVNSSKDDFGFIADGERKMGYLSSNRKRGGTDDDIYRFTRDCDEKPDCEEVQVIVYDAESKMPLDNADVSVIIDGKTEMKKTDSNGTFKICKEEGKECELKASREGYMPNTVGCKEGETTIDIPLSRIKETAIDSTANTSGTTTTDGSSTTYTGTTTTDGGTTVDGSTSGYQGTTTGTAIPCPATKTIRGRVTANKDKRALGGVTVTLRNECDGSTQSFVTGSDGRYQFEICEGCDYSIEAAKDNFGSRGNKIKKLGKGGPRTVNANLSMFEQGDVVAIDNIYYDYGKCNIREDASRELDKLAVMMKRYKSMTVEIRSHTDSRATTEFNQKVSEGRSVAVKKYLVKRGVSSSRIETSGYGESQLLNECADGVECTEEQHSANRRTEFKVIQLK